MRVTLKTFGGFAAALPRPELAVDSAALSPADAETLQALLTDAAHEAPPVRSPTSGDAQTYLIRSEGEGAIQEIRASDLERRPAFEALRSFLETRRS
jgi:hypothetical protein